MNFGLQFTVSVHVDLNFNLKVGSLNLNGNLGWVIIKKLYVAITSKCHALKDNKSLNGGSILVTISISVNTFIQRKCGINKSQYLVFGWAVLQP